MKSNWLLSLSAIYLALIGLGFLIAPDAVMFGTVGAGASAALVANLRGTASTFIGIAVLNWFARNAEPSKALNAIFLANTVGFGLAGILDLLALASGAPTPQLVPAVINLLFAVSFAWLGRAMMSSSTK